MMYEVLRTKTVKDPSLVLSFEIAIKDRIAMVDDRQYRMKCLHQTLDAARLGPNRLSLVDTVIREMIRDKKQKIDEIWTYNKQDFEDVCLTRGVIIWSG